MKYYIIFLIQLIGLFSFGQQKEDRWPLVYHQDFSTPQALFDFNMTDTSAWRLNSTESTSLELFQQSDYSPPNRSPLNIAVIDKMLFGSFKLELRLAQTGKEYGHRDLCIFFGIKDPANFYYIHMATKTDDHANNIFLVEDAPRIKISSKTNAGTGWGDTGSWHHVKIIRDINTGLIEMYFDGASKPSMTASDVHFTNGRIGFGSFDDTGKFDDIKIFSPQVIKSSKPVFE